MLSAAICAALSCASNKPKTKAWTTNTTNACYIAEQHILDETLPSPLHKDYIPVAIYKVEDGVTNFNVLGTYVSSGGTNYLVTVAHVFYKRDGERAFIVRKLTPVEEQPSLCISGVTDIDVVNDVAECSLAPMPASGLPSVYCGEVGIDNTYNVDSIAFDGQVTLTSLVSGQEVIIVGALKRPDTGATFYVAKNSVSAGDSGMGYVNKAGNLFLIEGAASAQPPSKEPNDVKYSPVTTFTGPIAMK